MAFAALAAIAVLVVGVSSAVAHKTSFSSEIQIVSVAPPPDDRIVEGTVESPKAKCLPRRKVKLFAIYPDQSQQLIAATKTRENPAGLWTGEGDFTGAIKIKAKVLRKNIGPTGHRHICKSDTDKVPVSP
jgi:hypothetical protein